MYAMMVDIIFIDLSQGNHFHFVKRFQEGCDREIRIGEFPETTAIPHCNV